MAEPTLGQRIAEAAAAWAVAADAEVWGQIDGYVSDGLWADLLTLCDRADAAERLAKAADALGWTDAADYMSAADEFKVALAAWREATNE